MKINCITNFQSYPDLRQDIYNLTKSSYVDPTAILEREYHNNQKVYLQRNGINELIAFFMSGINKFDELEINYLGLACVKHEYKNTGIIMQLFIKGIEDAINFNLPKKCWLTTPSIQIFKMIHCIFDLASPSPNFEFSETAFKVATKINLIKHYVFKNENPFIIRGIAQLTKYSTSEPDRIDKHKKDHRSDLFINHKLDERNGDS